MTVNAKQFEERFALLFTSDGSEDKSQPVPQQTLSMRNDTLGQLNIFVVPVAQEDGKFIYEAVFNRREG
ncbi:MAG: hypothetical protein P8Y42_21310 [Exilibacterium sp.]